MSNRIIGVFLSSLVFVMVGTASALPIAHLHLESDPGDFVGDGQTFDKVYDTSQGDSATSGVWVPRSPEDRSGIQVYLDDGLPGVDHFAVISLGTSKLGVPLAPGVYLDAQAWSFEAPGHPGLDVSFQHRDPYQLTGQFTIYEMTFSPDRTALLSLVVEFEQHVFGEPPALRGRLAYNAAGLTAIPEPTELLLIGFGLAGIACSKKKSRKLYPSRFNH